jgi:hypothetical protein
VPNFQLCKWGFDGQAIALQRIAAEARDRSGFLDLSQPALV